MDDKTLADQPEVELDAEMAQRILDEGDTYSQQTSELVQFIHENRAAFREELFDRKLIQITSENVDGFDLAAVDGASAIKSHGGGALVAAAAYKSSINDERQRGIPRVELVPNHVDIEAFATLLRTHLKTKSGLPGKDCLCSRQPRTPALHNARRNSISSDVFLPLTARMVCDLILEITMSIRNVR